MLKRRRTEQDNLLESQSFAPPPPRTAPPPSPESIKRRRRRRGTFTRQFAAVAGIAVAAYVTLPILLRASKLHPVLEATLSRDLGRRVTIGSLRFSPTFGSIVATDVSVAEDPLFSAAPFFHARTVEVSVRRMPLIFSQAIEIAGISIEEPTITVIKSAGQWNYYAILAAGPTPPDASPGPWVEVRQGILAIRAGDRDEPFVLRDLSFHAAHFSTAQDNAFTLKASVEGGGSLKLEGRAGPVRWPGRAPSLPLNVLVSAKGVAIDESNLTHTLAPGVAGRVSMDGTVESNGTTVLVTGNAEFAGLKFSGHGQPATDPVRVVLAVEHDLTTGAGKLNRCDATLPKGTAGISGTYALADNGMRLSLHASAQGIAVTPLSGMVQAAGVPLPPGTSLQGGVAFTDLTIEGPLKSPTTKGSVTIQNTKLLSFDLEERLSSVTGLDALHISRDLAINAWRANVEMTPEKVVLSNLEVDVPEVGTLTGGGVIDANRTLNFQMNAVRNGVSEKHPIPFLVRGACVSPIFRQPGKAL